MRVIFRSRRSIWWSWRMTPDAPRIVLDVSYVTLINHENLFSWQAQYLVKLEDDSCCSAHCTGRFICDADQSWDSFFVAGAVFLLVLKRDCGIAVVTGGLSSSSTMWWDWWLEVVLRPHQRAWLGKRSSCHCHLFFRIWWCLPSSDHHLCKRTPRHFASGMANCFSPSWWCESPLGRSRLQVLTCTTAVVLSLIGFEPKCLQDKRASA